MRLAALLAALLLAAAPASAAAPSPAPVLPPAGTVIIQAWVFDGAAVLPAGQWLVPPIACSPVAP